MKVWPRGRTREERPSEVDLGEPVLIRSGAMDQRFRRICAVYADGRCLIARGYEADPGLRTALVELKQQGVLPDILVEETVTMEEIAGYWNASGAGFGEGGGIVDEAIIRSAGRLFEAAAAARASDLIFEREGGVCRISVIVNDRKLFVQSLTVEEGSALTGYLFYSKDGGSAQTSYQHRSFQGFSIRAGAAVPLPAAVSGLRCERGPHEPDGDHLFVRIFYRDRIAVGTTLEDLGFSALESALFSEIRASLSGGVFLGGSTGDGKSTTLAVNLTLQQAEMAGQLNIVTVEDPVEYLIPGAVQIAVPTTGLGEERGGHFRRALMHFCRINPSVGMVSEIRDADAAREVLQFIDTGHQVWTTIHVHSANGILFRLLDMGVAAAELCKPGNVKLLMKQALVPQLCEACAGVDPAGSAGVPDWLNERVRGFPAVRYRNPAGCARCLRDGESEIARQAWAGYAGRTALAETVRPDPGYLEFVRDRDVAGAWEYWIKQMGGVPIGGKIWLMVARGDADPFDALRKGAGIEHAEMAAPAVDGLAVVR